MIAIAPRLLPRAVYLLPALLALLAIALATIAVNTGQTNERLLSDKSGTPYSSYMQPGRQFTQWDGYRYEEIIKDGYLTHLPTDPPDIVNSSVMPDPHTGERRLKNVVWYPLYPLLGAVAMQLTGLPAHHALTLVSWLSIILGSVVFFAVARWQILCRQGPSAPDHAAPPRCCDISNPDLAALLAVAFLLFAPCAVFLYANYTESLFVLLLALFLFCLQRKYWWRAALVAAISSACRSQGVLFGPILALMFLVRAPGTLPRKLGPAFVFGLISAIGLISYMLFLGHRFQDPLAFMKIQIHWDVGLDARHILYALNPAHAFGYAYFQLFQYDHFQWPLVIEALSVIVAPAILLLGARRLSFEMNLMGWILWLLPFISNSLAPKGDDLLHWMSMGRFMTVVLPIQIVLAILVARWRWLIPFLLAVSLLFFTLLAHQYGGGAWVG